MGSSTQLYIDDADGAKYNSSLILEGQPLLQIDKQRGVQVGRLPQNRHYKSNETTENDFIGNSHFHNKKLIFSL